ncbi:MAG: hypothetical protein ABUR63_09340 [Verrucomicrobiota bacterium]
MRHRVALAVALAGAIEVAVQVAIYIRVPAAADWDAAAGYVRRQLRPGDGLVFAPHWVDPIGRLHFGELVSVEEAARPDRSRQGRIWEVSIRGKRHPDAIGREADSRAFGRVQVRLFERTPAEVLFDFTSARPERRHVAEIDFLPYMCLPAVPGDTLDFADVPLGATIALGGGIADFQSRYDSEAPVTLQTFVDGVPIAREAFDNHGWRRVAVDTARFAGARHAVRFQVTAAQPRSRTFCFHAEAHR